MFPLLYGRHEGHKHGVSIQSSMNLGDTLLQITHEWKTAETWCLARLFIYQSSMVSQILDYIHWMFTIFSFEHMTGENREFILESNVDQGCFWFIVHSCKEIESFFTSPTSSSFRRILRDPESIVLSRHLIPFPAAFSYSESSLQLGNEKAERGLRDLDTRWTTWHTT